MLDMPKIFIVNGQGAAGKDTFEKFVKDFAEEENIKIGKISTIDFVKEIARECYWNGEKDQKSRKFLSDLKDAMTAFNNIPFTETCNKIEQIHKNENIDFIFVDCREPEEIIKFVTKFNALTILVERTKTIIEFTNHADMNVYNYNYDVVIDNTRGLGELKEEARIFFETFIKSEVDKNESN